MSDVGYFIVHKVKNCFGEMIVGTGAGNLLLTFPKYREA